MHPRCQRSNCGVDKDKHHQNTVKTPKDGGGVPTKRMIGNRNSMTLDHTSGCGFTAGQGYATEARKVSRSDNLFGF